MMLDDRSTASIKSEIHRDDATSSNGMNFVSNSAHSNFGLSTSTLEQQHVHRSHLTNNLQPNHHYTHLIAPPTSDKAAQSIGDYENSHQLASHHRHQQHQHNISDEQYLTSDETNSSSYNLNPGTPSSAGLDYHSHSNSTATGKNIAPIPSHSSRNRLDLVNAKSSEHSVMVPTTAHCSDQQSNMHYSLSHTTKRDLPTTSPSNMALNFSHDLLQGQSSLHHHSNDNGDHKPQLGGALDLESGNHLMQTAANMNIWKSTMGLGFTKHSSINEHSFLPTSDMNSFSNWSHANNLGHQAAPSMTHPMLDGQHLISYPQHNHNRSLQLPNQQDLVSAPLKNQVCAEQASFMISSINQVSQAQMNNHHGQHHSNDNLHLRSQTHDHSATSYNLSMNDNQFYNNRSHGNSIKTSVFLQDRSGPSHSNHHNSHLAYHNAEHANPHPTTSHHVAGSSAGSSSRNIGTFKCAHCSEIFSVRSLYQSHLKTHSQEKGSKTKFHCELCGHSFSQKTSLNRHMKSHTGERPFPCEVCGKAFSEKERLKIHMRTHTGEKPFSCNVCGKSFSQKSTVKRHQTVHTGEKKFKCDCGKGFANRGNLIAHIKTRGANHFE